MPDVTREQVHAAIEEAVPHYPCAGLAADAVMALLAEAPQPRVLVIEDTTPEVPDAG